MRFLEQVLELEDRLVATGRIKPTRMCAVMRSPRSDISPAGAVCFGGVTPAYAQRPVGQATLVPLPNPREEGFVNPHPAITPTLPAVIHRGRAVSFARGGDGQSLTRWGWSDPEEDFTWSVGLESALEFRVGEKIKAFELRFMTYQPPEPERGSLCCVLNGVEQERLEPLDRSTNGHLLRLRQSLRSGSSVLLELACSRPRRPDLDGGNDKRPIGIALISITAL